MNAKTRKYSRTTYGSSRKVVKKIPWKIDKYNIRGFLLITLCPCRAVFGNCYFWAIIDLPWCGRGTNKPLSWQVFILVKTAKISCVRLIAIAQEKTSTSQACSSRPKLIRQFSKMLEKRCLKQKFSQIIHFLPLFLLSRRALLSHDLTSFFNVQWWKFARWVSSLAL